MIYFQMQGDNNRFATFTSDQLADYLSGEMHSVSMFYILYLKKFINHRLLLNVKCKDIAQTVIG